MGIQASYWATGGIMAVLALIVGRWVLGMLGVVALGIGGFVLAAMAFLVKAAFLLLALWVVVRLVRRRPAAESR